MADQFALLESRIASLERIVFGSGSEQKQDQQLAKVLDRLISINQKLSQTMSSNEKLKDAMKQLITMRQYLDPAFVENLSAPLEAKYHVLELSASTLENRIKLLEQLKASESILDSEHIRNTPKSAGQLAQISIRQAEQAEAIQKHTSEVSDLFQTYCELVLALSKQAVYWDQSVTALEASKGKQQ